MRSHVPLSLERLREKFRERAYQALTIFDQYVVLLRGLSLAILGASEQARELRARVVVSGACLFLLIPFKIHT